ncbi:MAG TPA: ABC transporter permease [Polyangiales bacterium]|nr:ABC transporter permease [Polyangiales bacterium]
MAERPIGYLAQVRQQFLRRRSHRVCTAIILGTLLIAIAADLLASDLPLALSFRGQTHLLPNVFRPAALRGYDNQRLLDAMTPEDWAVFPPVPWGYNTHDLEAVLAPPSAEHWLGTDSGGRDVASRVIHGARVSLSVGILSVAVLLAIGVLFGSIAAYFGGWADLLLMRLLEIVHSLPTLLLLVTILAVIMPTGYRSILAMMLVIGFVRWTDVARLVRGEILRVRTMPYVEAARALGYGPARVIVRHILPNALAPVLVAATFAMASAILIEGALSFLGFGIPPDMASWGGMLNDVQGHTEAWWLAVFPGAAIFLTVTVYNLAGEGLRDAIDPRLKM